MNYRVVLVLTITLLCGCKSWVLGGPDYPGADPTPVPNTGVQARAPAQVALHLPDRLFSGGTWGLGFAIPLAPPDLMNTAGHRRPADLVRLGDVRTTDSELSQERYLEVYCGWAHKYHGCNSEEYTVKYAACTGCSGVSHKVATYLLVQDKLQQLRQRAGALGAHTMVNVRCYGFTDRHRIWCEGTAMTRPRVAAR